LNPEKYFHAVEAAAAIGVIGGRIYDTILVQCALKAKSQASKRLYMGRQAFQTSGRQFAGRVKIP